MAHPLHDQVRKLHEGRCGYCGVSEADAGGELTVDHHEPTSAGGTDALENLVYCCARCNLYKGNYWPTTEDILAGRRVLHPRHDDVATHVREDEQTGRLYPLTDAGLFHIAQLHLNRPALVDYRLHARLDRAMAEKQRLLESEIALLRETTAAQERYIGHLRRLLRRPPTGGHSG